MQSELERGDYAEVTAATPQGPQEVGILPLARHDELPISRYHVGGDEVVADEAERPREVADATAEAQTGDPRGRDGAARRGEAEGVSGVVEIAPGAPGLGADRAPRGIYADAL